MRLFSYVVRYDFGFAPNPFHDWCTLADCKPQIRESAEPGDWIMGTSSMAGRAEQTSRLVYAMQVDETLSFDEYWLDERFTSKRPNLRGSRMLQFGDNIYHHDRETTSWIQENSHHSNDDGTPNEANIKHDIKADKVLAGQYFVYFGGSGPEIPGKYSYLVASRRAYKCQFTEPQVADAVTWLKSLGSGVQGRPGDWD